jgi:hypothetical protein
MLVGVPVDAVHVAGMQRMTQGRGLSFRDPRQGPRRRLLGRFPHREDEVVPGLLVNQLLAALPGEVLLRSTAGQDVPHRLDDQGHRGGPRIGGADATLGQRSGAAQARREIGCVPGLLSGDADR